MSAATVCDAICKYFAGSYDPTTRTYHSPQIYVPGLTVGAIRRARPKRLDDADYFLGQPGSPVGCQIYIRALSGQESRDGLGGPTTGLKRVRHNVVMDCMLRSDSRYAEDTQDALYALLDAITAHIHADRTCGTGGIEAGGFNVGEGGAPWISWQMSDVVSTAEKTTALLRVSYSPSEYIFA